MLHLYKLFPLFVLHSIGNTVFPEKNGLKKAILVYKIATPQPAELCIYIYIHTYGFLGAVTDAN